jgi:hypothetical protein
MSEKSSEYYYTFLTVAVIVGFIVIIAALYYNNKNDANGFADISSNDIIIPDPPDLAVVQTQAVTSASFSGGSISGQKRALLIGCNYDYAGSPCLNYGCTLYGCIEDVKNIRTLLIAKGYLPQNIVLLVDDGTTDFPDRSRFLSSFSSLVNSMQEGDTSFVWFSGHGAQLRNATSDGGYNECWCPPDTIDNGNFITDDELNEIVKIAPSNSTIFIGSDSCHSGTVFDLKYIAQEVDGSFANRDLDSIRGRIPLRNDFEVKFNSNTHLADRLIFSSDIVRSSSRMQILEDDSFDSTKCNIIVISGCQDYSTSADAWQENIPQGAMSWAFRKCFADDISLVDLLRNMRTLLKSSGFTQIPQLTMGQLIDPNTIKMENVLKGFQV